MITLDAKNSLGIFQKHLAGLGPQATGEPKPQAVAKPQERAADAVSLSDNQTRETKAYGREIKDANEAIGALQIASGAVNKMTKSGENLEWLAQAYQDQGLDANQKQEIKEEVMGTIGEIKTRTEATKFMGKELFGQTINLSFASGSVQIGLNAPDVTAVNIEEPSSASGFVHDLRSLQQGIQGALGEISTKISENSSSQVAKNAESRYDYNQFDAGLFKTLHRQSQ